MSSAKPCKVLLIGSAALLVSLGLLPLLASAQSQGDTASVAEAARRAREQKKAAAKPARTLTNDDLPPVPAESRVSLAPPPAAGEAVDGAQAKTEDGAAPADADALKKERAKLEEARKRAKAELSEAQGEVDVLERKAALDNDTFYSKPGYASDSEGKARLDAEAQQVAEKKRQVADLKAKLAALEAALGLAPEPAKDRSPSAN